MMAKVHNSPATPGRGEDERLLKALMISSIGKIPLDVAISLSPSPAGMSPKSAVSQSDSDLRRYSSKGNTYREQISNLEDCKNAKFKLAQYRQMKASRLERENKKKKDKNKGDEKSEPRRRRRKSAGSAERRRKKDDAERVRKKIEDDVHVTEDDDVGSQDPHRDNKTRKIKHNTLSSYFSTPEHGNRQARRSCRSIDTSSTTKTKKQSNSSGKKGLSVNDLVTNSPWANGGKKNPEALERRIRKRIPRNSRMRDQMDNHYPSPASDGMVRKHFKRRSNSHGDVKALAKSDSRPRNKSRSHSDVSALTKSDSGTRNKPRRKYRNDMSGSIDLIPNMTFSLSKSPGAVTPNPAKTTTEKTYISEPGLVTPYSVPRESNCKSSARSYSDRVMIAAESNKTPMASLKKYLKDEKIFNSSENPSANRVPMETRSLGQIPRKKVSQNLLKIPFSDGASNTEISEKEDEEEADNSKTALSVKMVGKSVAKSMKRQAKNTKRKIGKQISKMTTSNATVEDNANTGNPIFDKDFFSTSRFVKNDKNVGIQQSPVSPLVALKPPSGIVPSGPQEETQSSPTSPLVALKPPSGICPDEDDDDSSHFSPLVALKPPSGHVPRKESGFQKSASTYPDLPPLHQESELDQKQRKKPRKKTRSNGNKKSRRRRKSSTKKKIVDGHSEVSMEEPFVQVINNSWSDQGSSSRSFAPNEHPVFDDPDEVAEDSTLERSYKINPALHQNGKLSEESYPFIVDGDSTIIDDERMNSPHYAYDASTINSFASASLTTKQETSIASRLSTSEDIHTSSCDRNNSSSMSTLITAPSSPSRTQSKSTTEKSYGSEIQHDSGKLGPDCSTIDEEDPSQQPDDSNNSEYITVLKGEETDEKEANMATDNSGLPLRGTQASIEETETNNLASEAALNMVASNQNVDDRLPKQVGPSEDEVSELVAPEFQDIPERQKTAEPDLSTELLDLLKKNGKSKKASRAKDRKETTKKLYEKHKKEMERLKRNHEQLMEMDITVDPDPLAVSEISIPPHTIEQKPAKPRRTSKSGEAKSSNTSKEKKSKSHRRDSKTKSRKKQDNQKGGSLTSPPVGVIEEKDDARAAEIVNKSNSQILSLRLMLLQSNPTIQPMEGIGGLPTSSNARTPSS